MQSELEFLRKKQIGNRRVVQEYEKARNQQDKKAAAAARGWSKFAVPSREILTT